MLLALVLGVLFELVRSLAATGAQTRFSKMSLYPGRATFMVGSVAEAASPRPTTRIGQVCLAVLILLASGPTALAARSGPSLGIWLSSVGDRPENPAGPASASRMLDYDLRATFTTAPEFVATKNPAVGNDLLKPGPWANESVVSSGPGKITAAERQALQPIGDANGCHSCGATTSGTKSGNWVGDHQPVSSGVPAGTPQVLYPHCITCSNTQGLWIINLTKKGFWPPKP
jgi:hypothetical protein